MFFCEIFKNTFFYRTPQDAASPISFALHKGTVQKGNASSTSTVKTLKQFAVLVAGKTISFILFNPISFQLQLQYVKEVQL